MKSLKESLFSDNITTDVPVNFDFVIDYVRNKIQKANKKGIDVDMYKTTNQYNCIVSFYSSRIKNARKLYEQININFEIAHPNDTVGIKPFIVFGVDDSFNFEMLASDSERVLNRIKGITFNSVWSDQPDKLIKTIDGFFEGFEKINKDKQPIITGPRQIIINNIGLGLFYNKMKRCFEYPDLKKID